MRIATTRRVYSGGPLDGLVDELEAAAGSLPRRVSSGWPGDDQDDGLASGVYELARLGDGVGFYDWCPHRHDAQARPTHAGGSGRERLRR
jgi:hypothetical protein